MLKVVVAGFGFMGMTHAGNILKNPQARLTAVTDKSTASIEEKLKVQSGNFETAAISPEAVSEIRLYNDFKMCLDAEKPDACVIAVHTNLHYELARMALESGVHVFLEKPFTLDVEEGTRLIDLAARENKVLMVGHVVRFMPAYLLLREWIESGKYGKPEFLSFSRFTGVPSWGQWKEIQKNFGSSGGALFDLVIHDIDFARWVCGDPDEIHAQCLPGKLSSYDYVSAIWKYNEKNLHVKIDGGNIFHADFPFQVSFHARFAEASVHYSSADGHNVVLITEAGSEIIAAGDPNDGFSGELGYFIDCVVKHQPPGLCTPESALETIRTCYRHTSNS